MKCLILMAVIVSLAGVVRAAETCTVKEVTLPVVEVSDLHQEIDIPAMETTCLAGKCKSRVAEVKHFSTEPQYRIALEYKGDTYSYEASEAPVGKTVLAHVRECGKKRSQRTVNPAS